MFNLTCTYWYHLSNSRSRYGTEERIIIKWTHSLVRSVSDTLGEGKQGQEQGPCKTPLQKKTDGSHLVLNKVMRRIWVGSNSHLLLCQLLLATHIGDAALWAVQPAAPRWVTQQVAVLPSTAHKPTRDDFFFHCFLWRTVPLMNLKTSPTRWPNKSSVFEIMSSFRLYFLSLKYLKKTKDF